MALLSAACFRLSRARRPSLLHHNLIVTLGHPDPRDTGNLDNPPPATPHRRRLDNIGMEMEMEIQMTEWTCLLYPRGKRKR